jgi:hypothetical protein
MAMENARNEGQSWRTGRQAVAPKEGREWDAIREKSRYRGACSCCWLAGWMDGLSKIYGK